MLADASRQEDERELMSSVLHDLRNVRSVPQGMLDLFNAGKDYTEKEYLEALKIVNDKLTTLIDKLEEE